jgi:adhesin/invasin
MVIGFMITCRPLGRLPQLPVILAATFGLLTVSCEKVPLLAPSTASITLTASATALPLNGTTDLIVQVLEQAGTPPHSGTHVIFTTNLGSVQPSEAQTDLNGRVVVKFHAGTASGTATVTASSGGAGSSSAPSTGTGTSTATTDSRTVKIAIGSAAVGSVVVAANPGTVPSIGGNSTITATVLDASGNLLSGIPVTFSVDAGVVSPTLVTTDATGKAQSTLTTSRTAKVTASAGVGTPGATATAAPSSSVTVNVNATQTITIGTPAPPSPVINQTVSLPLAYSTTSGATPVIRVTVNWGDGRVETFSGQPGAVQHVYFEARSFVVVVTGTDSTGDTSTTSTTITVGREPKPSVGISADNDHPTTAQVVTFTVTASVPNAGSTGTAIQNTHLDYGDGSSVDLGSAASSTPKHTYTTGGVTRTATATTTDTNGNTATAQVTINVQ